MDGDIGQKGLISAESPGPLVGTRRLSSAVLVDKTYVFEISTLYIFAA